MAVVFVVYDAAFYYTSQEMHEKGENIDVLTVIEDPELHILSVPAPSLTTTVHLMQEGALVVLLLCWV